MKRLIVVFVLSLSLSVFVFANELINNFKISGDLSLYFQSSALSKNKTFIPANKGFGEVLDLELSSSFSFGSFYARFHNGNGEGADKFFGDFLFANIDTLNDDNTEENYDLTLLEGYFSFSFFNGGLNVIAGKTEPLVFVDDNEFANDELTQFIGKPFVNNVFIDSEDKYAPILGGIFSGEKFELSFFLQSIEKHKPFFNGESWEIVDTGHHGEVLQNLTTGGQIKYKLDLNGRKGNYRFYFYNNSHPHFSIHDNLTDGSKNPQLRSGVGYGVSIDQYLTKNLGVFFRYGKSLKEIYLFGEQVSFGFKCANVLNNKDAVLFGCAKITHEKGTGLEDENHFEVQYQYNFSENSLFAIDLQYINHLIDLQHNSVFALTVRFTQFF